MAKFEKGRAKTGGRVKGTPNRARIKKVAEVLAENNVDCVAAVLDLLLHGDIRDADRAKLYLELHSYIEVKPKETPGEANESSEDPLAEISEETLLKLVTNEAP